MSHLTTAVLVGVVAVVGYWYLGSSQLQDLDTTKLDSTYDYIIVGAGSSGSVVAARLSEDANSSVLLLEAGGREEENPLISIPAAAIEVMGKEQDWSYYTEPQKHNGFALGGKRSFWPRGRVLGGSSAINWMVYMRGNRHDYDSWAAEGCDGWRYKDVLPYFMKSENMEIFEYKTSPYHGIDGPLYVSAFSATLMQQKYLDAGQDLGYTTGDCNGEDQIGFCRTHATIHNGQRWTTYQAFLKPTMTRPNLHVSTHSFVTKVIIENKKAVGVELIRQGRKMRVYANKEVILSGGSVNTPQLLMLSGIGPKDHLKDMGIDVVMDLPVGQNLQDHIQLPLLHHINITAALTKEKLASPSTVLQYLIFKSGYLVTTSLDVNAFLYKDANSKNDNGQAPDIQIQFFSMHTYTEEGKQLGHFNYDLGVKDKIFINDPKKESVLLLPVLLHPKSRGSIRLKSKDPFDYPSIDPHYMEEQEDVDTLIAGVRFIEKFVETPTMRKIGMTLENTSPLNQVCAEHQFRSDAFWDCYIRHFTLTMYHPTSTCRMGADNDPTAVVDPQLRVKGVSGLRVVDASVMRNIPSANTNAPAIMIGEKASDLIRGKDTVDHIRYLMRKKKA